MQKHSSKNTSINKTKLPAIYNAFPFKKGSVVFDYGCGRYTDHIQNKMEEMGCEWYGYDLNWKPEGYSDLKNKKFDVCICANLLNVIDDDEVVDNIINDVIVNSELAVFQIYEGDGSGVGKQSKEDCWQRNEKTNSYLNRINSLGYKGWINGKYIMAS